MVSLRLHGDTLAAPGMLDFAVNVWPAPRPPALDAALAAALARGDRYPDENDARRAVARRHGRDPDEVLLTNGACEAFWLFAHACAPHSAAVIHPSFTEPEAALRSVGGDVRHVLREPETWRLEPGLVPHESDCVVLGNPNNPTGTLDPPEMMLALARPGRSLLLDESFIDFAPSADASLASHREVPGLVVVRSLTKLWSLAGIRAGYLLAPASIVQRLTAHRQPWSVNALACAALEWCAGDADTPRRVAAEVTAARTELAGTLAQLDGLRVWPSAANFLLIRVADGPRLVDGLRRRGIAVRPAASFPGLDERFIRIAVRRSEDNGRLVAAVTELLS